MFEALFPFLLFVFVDVVYFLLLKLWLNCVYFQLVPNLSIYPGGLSGLTENTQDELSLNFFLHHKFSEETSAESFY